MGASTQNLTEPPPHPGDAEIAPLEWDSRHFGFQVARIRPSESGEEALAAVLARARRQGMAMVVWSTMPETHVPDKLLRDFRGELVDEKTTFAAGLATAPAVGAMAKHRRHQGGETSVHPYTDEAASDELLALSIAAGIYSRFNRDPRFPREKFKSLYRTWMERSVRRELADVVLVARDAAKPNSGLLGMVTVSAEHGMGTIGLIAVAETARGRGLGLRLVEAAHDWMRGRGAVVARVVTQGANQSACRLYERAGYRLSSVEHYYHFWPQTQG
jgi:dTDP-4-amino-4,6-dideoxy-D-galactose acyltransferase